MSHSLNVVSIAAVCCAWTRRSAIRCLIFGIFSRRTPRAPATAIGMATAGTGFTGLAIVDTAVAARSTSAITIRPDVPLPVTFARSTPLSAATFLASDEAFLPSTGSATTAALTGVAAAGALLAALAGLAALAALPAPAASPAPPLAPAGFAAAVSIAPIGAPTFCSAPDCTLTRSTPAAGARTSKVALSLSMSTKTSSVSTQSPSCLCH